MQLDLRQEAQRNDLNIRLRLSCPHEVGVVVRFIPKPRTALYRFRAYVSVVFESRTLGLLNSPKYVLFIDFRPQSRSYL